MSPFQLYIDGEPAGLREMTLEATGHGQSMSFRIKDPVPVLPWERVELFSSEPRFRGRLGTLLRRIGINPHQSRLVFVGWITRCDSNGGIEASDEITMLERSWFG